MTIHNERSHPTGVGPLYDDDKAVLKWSDVPSSFVHLEQCIRSVEELLVREADSFRTRTKARLSELSIELSNVGEEADDKMVSTLTDDEYDQELLRMSLQGERLSINMESDEIGLLFPTMVRHALFTLSCSLLERWLLSLCGMLRNKQGYSLNVSDLRGSDFERAVRYLEAVAVARTWSSDEKEEIENLRKIRNRIVHNQSSLRPSDDRLRAYLVAHGQEIGESGEFGLTKDFCLASCQTMSAFVVGVWNAAIWGPYRRRP